jgi:hypothetical protein
VGGEGRQAGRAREMKEGEGEEKGDQKTDERRDGTRDGAERGGLHGFEWGGGLHDSILELESC